MITEIETIDRRVKYHRLPKMTIIKDVILEEVPTHEYYEYYVGNFKNSFSTEFGEIACSPCDIERIIIRPQIYEIEKGLWYSLNRDGESLKRYEDQKYYEGFKQSQEYVEVRVGWSKEALDKLEIPMYLKNQTEDNSHELESIKKENRGKDGEIRKLRKKVEDMERIMKSTRKAELRSKQLLCTKIGNLKFDIDTFNSMSFWDRLKFLFTGKY